MFSLLKKTTICLVFLTFFHAAASSGETYKFERMWPVTKQPWYFPTSSGIAADSDGFVYITDLNGHFIQKFTSDGYFVTRWGRYGTGEGEFDNPDRIAVDNKNGFLYVTDKGNKRVQKFTRDGIFVDQWGGAAVEGGGTGRFRRPKGIAVDSNGYVYVSDSEFHSVQKFTQDGEFVSKWGQKGTGNGYFDAPLGITAGSNDHIYVADSENHRIQKFTSEGVFVTAWGREGEDPGEFRFPRGVAADNEGFVYVADERNNRIQKFDADGIFVTEWGHTESEASDFLEMISSDESDGDLFDIATYLLSDETYGELMGPRDIAIDRNAGVYVADAGNHRIQRFDSQGKFLRAWTGGGTGNGMFRGPAGIAVDDKEEFIYVADVKNHRIQKFQTDGTFVKQWGSDGNGDGEFRLPAGIALDTDGYVYVSDLLNSRIQKFNSQGEFEKSWNREELFGVLSLAVRDGYIYAANVFRNRIQKFASNGEVTDMEEWEADTPVAVTVAPDGTIYWSDQKNNGVYKLGPGKEIPVVFKGGDGEAAPEPLGLAVDSEGYVYVANWKDAPIQKFAPDGTFVTNIGEIGSGPGQFVYPTSLCVGSVSGRIYMADIASHRIQVFGKRPDSGEVTKAVIVAGRSSEEKDDIWDATQVCANFAYRAMRYQGFARSDIFYLSAGATPYNMPDDVDAEATGTRLESALETWAEDADQLVIYIVDHGAEKVFMINEAEEVIASDLDSWLDSLQEKTSCKIVVVYEACKSGSFLSELTPPAGKERIMITSTSPDKDAYLLSKGMISFSGFFWTHIFNGLNTKTAFDMAREGMEYMPDKDFSDQHPLMDDNGDGKYEGGEGSELAGVTYIGNGIAVWGDAPGIRSVSLIPDVPPDHVFSTGDSVTFSVEAENSDDIAQINAIVKPPGYQQRDSGYPVQYLPSVELMHVEGGRYEGTYHGLTTKGTYQIAIYATDREGNISSLPEQLTITVEPLTSKAVILGAISRSDERWPVAENLLRTSYHTLSSRGYSDDEIYLMNPAGIPEVSKDTVLPDSETLTDYVLKTWAATNTCDVLLYLLGDSDKDADGEPVFCIPDESDLDKCPENLQLSASVLDSRLDALQAGEITVTVIYEGNDAAAFLRQLNPPDGKRRILIGSTIENHSPDLLPEGDLTFSKFFWTGVSNGSYIRDIVLDWQESTLGGKQTPYLDANGNGISLEYPGDTDPIETDIIGYPLMGDVDRNGWVDLSDAILALKIAADQYNGEVKIDACFSGDGETGIRAAVYVLQMLVR